MPILPFNAVLAIKKKNQGYALVCHFNLPIGIKFGKQMYYKMKSSCIWTKFHIELLTNVVLP